jgi:hypothetical protein
LCVGNIKYVGELFQEAAKLLQISEIPIGAALARRFVVQMLRRIVEARHGGCVLVLPLGKDPSSLPMNVKYSLDSDVIQAVIRARAPLGPKVWVKGGVTGQEGPVELLHDDSTVADALLLDRDLHQVTELVAHFSAVDGALVLGRDMRLYGFGAEIALAGTPSADEMIEYGNHPTPMGKPPDARLVDFGMRHRSAARFCQQLPGALAFVISQDGSMRLFCNVDGRVRQFVELAAEEW